MSQQELLEKVIAALETAGIPYMLTGSLVSSLQGYPRATHDIDLVVSLEKGAVATLAEAFPEPDYYLDERSASQAIDARDVFNLIDTTGGGKVDFWMLTDEPFDRSRFSRRYVERFMGRDMYVSTPEDTILMKLKWAQACGGSEKMISDAVAVFEVQSGALDMDYMARWVDELGLGLSWERLVNAAEGSP